MATIDFPVRRFAMMNTGWDDIGESRIAYRYDRLTVDPAECALVLVDFWSTHILWSHIERYGDIVKRKVVPLLPVARKTGFRIVHAPGISVAAKYASWNPYANDTDSRSPEAPAWPPEEFRQRLGAYAAFASPIFTPPVRERADEYFRIRRIHEAVEPERGDHVVATGEQLHRLLEEMGVLHIFYLGFAANECILNKDYGILAMADRGYNIVLLRDCTTGVENSLSLHEFGATKAAIRYVELYHPTTTSSALIDACGS